MDIESKIELVKKATTIEIVTEENLRQLLESNSSPKHYIGFEISGMVHLGTGLLTALKIQDFIKAGIKPTIFLADYHAWINGKLGGDLQKIQRVAKGYFKHAFYSLGLDESKVNFIMGSDLYDEKGKEYWADVMRITNNTTKERMLRCTTIMGRKEGDKAMPTSVMLYPAMQVADMWAMDIDIAQAGMDQRKVHILARELSEKMKRKKPVAVHGALLASLTGPGRMDANMNADDKMIEEKMSKSKPDSCIFIHDSEEQIKRKIKKAHCPEKVVEGNPIIQYANAFVLRDRVLEIQRDEKFGGDIEFVTSKELEDAFREGKLHPVDLKNAVARELIEMLKPSREYFQKHPELIEELK